MNQRLQIGFIRFASDYTRPIVLALGWFKLTGKTQFSDSSVFDGPFHNIMLNTPAYAVCLCFGSNSYGDEVPIEIKFSGNRI
jgi:hypothetical protein